MSDLMIDVNGYIGVYQNSGLFVDGKIADIEFDIKVAEIDKVEKKLEFLGGLNNTIVLQSYAFAELIVEFNDVVINDSGIITEFRISGVVRFKVPVSELGDLAESLTKEKEIKKDFVFCNQLIKP